MQENLQIKSAAITDRGLNEKRVINEDSYIELFEKGLFAVADGVGGAQAGEVASKMAVEILAEAFQNWTPQKDAEELMRAAIEKANEAVYQTAKELPALSTMATTIVALHINGNIATIGHVGDSRLYRLDPQGNLFRETQDHSILEEEIRAGRITPAQAANHPYRNVISRAIGAEKQVEADMKTIMIQPNTTFLLCSDGITRHVEDYEIREILLENQEPKDACQKLKQICYKRGAEDNLTAIVVKVIASQVAQTPEEDEEKTISTIRESASGFATKETEPEKVHLVEKTPTEVETKSRTETVATPEIETVKEKPRETIEQVEEEKESPISFAKRFFSSILLVVLGAIAGITLYHFIFRNLLFPTETKEILIPPVLMASPDIEYTSFENNRRNVDADPTGYIQVAGNKAETAEDFYLLGRAYFLSGNYEKAKEAFNKAKEVVSEAKQINRKTLENEIALGLSIVENSIARKEFITQKKSIQEKEKQIEANKDIETKANEDIETKANANISPGENFETQGNNTNSLPSRRF